MRQSRAIAGFSTAPMQRYLLLHRLEDWLLRSTANLEAALERLQKSGCTIALVECTPTRCTLRGQNVHPLHHTQILMIEDVAMRNKTADSHRIEVRPKRD